MSHNGVMSHHSSTTFPAAEGCGLEQALDQPRDVGLGPSGAAVDMTLLAAAIAAARTRISRDADDLDAARMIPRRGARFYFFSTAIIACQGGDERESPA